MAKSRRPQRGREVRRPMAPVTGSPRALDIPDQGQVPDIGFDIPPPKGIRPYMNPRVAVGDERLSEEERALYEQRNAPVNGRRVARRPQQPANLAPPDDEELDELGNDDEGFEEEETADPQLELEEEQFSTPAPVVAPMRTRPPAARTTQPAQPAAATGLHLPNVMIEDTDHVWDWVRADGGGKVFFGKEITNSLELHDMMKAMLKAEEDGTGAVRSIYYGARHIGMLALVPILSTERVAIMHAYLDPAVRKNLSQLLTGLVAMSLQLVPNYHIGLMAFNNQQTQLYQQQLGPYGFKAHTLFIR